MMVGLSRSSYHITLAEQDGVLWLASKHKAKKISLKTYKQFEVCYMKPGKGGGFVAIQTWPQEKGRGCISIIDFSVYSEQALKSAIDFASQLEPMLGYELKQDYWGVDC